MINCFLYKHIIGIIKAPNDLTASEACFMLIKKRERKRENHSRPKQRSPLKIRVKNSFKTNIMIRLFSQLCKCFKEISFKNEINTFHEYLKTFNVEALVCPFCGAKHGLSKFTSYKRHLVTYDNNTAQDNIITIPRYICSSCGHTHALLPSVIIPYMSFSIKFTVSLIHDYLIHKFQSIETMCEHYGIAIATFYRILKKFKEHKQLWLGLLNDKHTSNLIFAKHLINSTFIDIEIFIINFLNRTSLSFLQGTS